MMPDIRRHTILMMLLLASLPLMGQDTIRTQVDVVVVPVSVRDSKGNPVENLKREDFRIFEDGHLQEIRSVSIESPPLSIAIMIDTNSFLLNHFADPFRSLSGALTGDDEAAIYQFDSRYNAEKVSDFTSSHDGLAKALSEIGNTARDPADRGSNEAPLFTAATDLETRPAGWRKLIVVFTGWSAGEGSRSVEEIRERLGRAQIQMSAVLLGHFFPVAPTSELRKYAEPTGGDVYRVTDDDRATALHDTFARIIEQARHQFVLTYVSNNVVPGPSPVNRKIEVKTNSRGLKASYRTGYLQYGVRK
jgi:VWFA-related protein